MGSQTFIPRDYDVFAGLDVDKRSISVTFTDHQGFLKSLRMPYSVEHLLNHVRKHFADRKVAFVYEAGPTGYGLYDGIVAQAYRRVPPLRSVPRAASSLFTSENFIIATSRFCLTRLRAREAAMCAGPSLPHIPARPE
jgi:hypothetical protein